MTTAGQRVQPPAGWAELARLAWHRSWQFIGPFRRTTRAAMAASQSWTWQWLVVAWQAVACYPTQLITAGAGAGQIRVLGAASARVHPATGRGRGRARWDGVLLAAVTVVLTAAALLAAIMAAELADATVWVAVVLSAWVLGLVLTLLRPMPQGVAALARHARQVTAGRAVVLTDVVVGRQLHGSGIALMRALHELWVRERVEVAVLWAGSEDLVRFYRDVVGGWVLDEGSTSRMIWTAGGERR